MLSGVRYGTIYYYVYCDLDNRNAEDLANLHDITGNYRFTHPPLRRNLRRQMLNVACAHDTQLRIDTGIKGVSNLLKLK